MTMKKKLLALTSIVLILGMATLGILAYLTATGEATNTLTAGNVSIKLIEQQRVNGESTEEGTLTGYEDEKNLLPATANYAATTDYWNTANNAVDKIVSVTNDGKNAAYIRTWFAFEAGSPDVFEKVLINKNETGIVWSTASKVSIEGEDYYVMSATYSDALDVSETTAVSLKQIALKSEATNDTIAAFGNDGYKVLVVAQAVQADGFENAAEALSMSFGDINPWIEAPKADVTKLDITPTVDLYDVSGHSSTNESATLDVAYSFKATDSLEEAEAGEYANWIADFVISFDKDVLKDTAGLAGNYGGWGWIGFKSPIDVEAGQEIYLLRDTGLDPNLTYSEVCGNVVEFLCGAFDVDGQNSGTTMTVELRLTNPNNEHNYLTIGKYLYTFK